MTTNRIDHLDEALLRAGHVDRRFYFSPPDDYVLAHMFGVFYHGADDEVCQRFVWNVNNRSAKDNAK